MNLKLRILLADDHTTVRFGVKSIVESQPDWEVVGEVVNGKQAVELASKLLPDLVIIDIRMPEMDGIEATRLLRTLNPPPKVLILSGQAAGADLQGAIDAGASGCVLKTDSPLIIQAAIEAVAEGRSFFSSSLGVIGAKEGGKGGDAGTLQALTPRLTPREKEVVRLIALGGTNKEIASKLGISPKTTDVHRTNIMRRLNAHSVAELVRYAIREQLIEP
jgi:two-component system, NarL family, response regulator NreC